MVDEDRDQANAALLLNEKINGRIAEALVALANENNTVAIGQTLPLPTPPSGDEVVNALLNHPRAKTIIYSLAAETARMLVKQAFTEYAQRLKSPTPTSYYTQPVALFGYVFSADQMPKQTFF